VCQRIPSDARRQARLLCAAVIREGTPADAAGASALFRVVSPEFVSTEASVRHSIASDPPRSGRRWWCAEQDGMVVGWASLGLVVETSEQGVAWQAVAVHPDFRGRGIGTELAALGAAHADDLGARKVHCWSRSDDATVRFVGAHGFRQTSSDDLLTVDPRTVPPTDRPEDVDLRPVKTFSEDPSALFHVDSVSMLDEPGEITFDDLQYDFWLEYFWGHPLLDRDASMVACVDGTPASATYLLVDRERGRATNNGTGTLPEYRGRGLATLAKRASLTRAAELGITAVYTGNDVTNAPMQAINRKLGYAACATMISWTNTLIA
jgi:RimJ/RimL family protein N-acetyltransferase